MAKIPINISLVTTNVKNNIASSVGLNLTNTGNSKGYFDLLNLQTGARAGASAASNKDWSNAWKKQQLDNEKNKRYKEDHTDPTPLLIDTIGSLPLESSRRRNYENLKLTLDGSASNVGYGLDTMTRESYRDLKRLSRQSEMIHGGLNSSLPDKQQLLGIEEGQYVSNLQDWRPSFANAGRRVSDAMGSHSDMEHAVAKDASGPAAFIPSSAMNLVDGISSHVGDQIEGAFKFTQTELLKNLPSKISGSMRQLSTALDSVLAVPFEIASDVYNGLRKLMTQLTDLLDSIKTKITKWVISFLGGLVDGLFPSGMLDGLIEAVSGIAKEFGDLFDMFGGFSVVAGIRDIFSNIASGNLLGALRSAVNLGKLLLSGFGSAGVVGGMAGMPVECLEQQSGLNKISSFARNLSKGIAVGSVLTGVLGSLPTIGKGLGNIGSVIGQTISGIAGAAISVIRNLGGIIAGLLPAGLNYVLGKLFGKLCNVGVVGNKGYSVGSIFDNHRNRAFERAMYTHASHASIIGPLFNKKTDPKGSYAIEANLSFFDDSLYVPGAQSAKGVTMSGPGGSIAFRPFGNI